MMTIRLEARPLRAWLATLAVALCVAGANLGCGGGTAKAPAASPDAASAAPAAAPAAQATDDDEPLPIPAYEAALPEPVRAALLDRATGDLDMMVARRLIRLGITVNRTFYFVDKGVQRGAGYEMGQAFEQYLNKKLKTNQA